MTDTVREALLKIAGPNWSAFEVDSPGAQMAAAIIMEMQRTAREALATLRAEQCED